MHKSFLRTAFERTASKYGFAVLALALIQSGTVCAQQSPQQAPSLVAQQTSVAVLEQPSFTAVKATPALEPAPFSLVTVPQEAPHRHGFWDRKNCALFAGTAALSAADFYLTRQNLANGGTELNPITRVFGRSTAGLAVNFSAQTASVIGLSYLFHRTGHHRLERMTTLVNMSASATAVTYDLAHR
jgi:hypothetical protein